MIIPPRKLSYDQILKNLSQLEKTAAKQERHIDELTARITDQEKLLAKKDQRIAELETMLTKTKKNSSNSSKPPSSDIVKPNPQKKSGKRKKGAQKGHPKHERKPAGDSFCGH